MFIGHLTVRVRIACLLSALLTAGLVLPGCDVTEPRDPEGSVIYPPIWYPEPCPKCETHDIDTHVVWEASDGPITLYEDVIIGPDGHLEILAGVEVIFTPGKVCVLEYGEQTWVTPLIRVLGTLTCRGTEEAPVVFSEPASDLRWTPIDGSGLTNLRSTLDLEGVRARTLYARGADMTITSSRIEVLRIAGVGTSSVSGCDLPVVELAGCSAALEGNSIATLVIRRGDPVIDRNTFSRPADWPYHAIYCQLGTQATITGSVFENYDTCIRIDGASPTAHRNNLLCTGPAVIVCGETTSGVPDTLDFSDNWWGTTSILHVPRRIEYERTHHVWPLTYVQYSPYAFTPFTPGD